MFKTLYYSLKIDTYYALNSFIYVLRKLPILKDIVTEDAYQSTFLKVLGGIIGILLTVFRMFFYRFLYFSVILFIADSLFHNTSYFYHIFFVFSIIGMFLNNKLLGTSLRKYLSVTVFKMDAKSYLEYNLFWLLLTNFILNSICFYLFGFDFGISLMLILFQLSLRIIGEGLSIWYYRKYNDFWYNNTPLYFTVLISLLSTCFLPFIGYEITPFILAISLGCGIAISIGMLYSIHSRSDYKQIYKQLNTLDNILSNDKDDARRSMVAVKNKDIHLDDKKVQGKTGYDYFNTIFFERHKNILLRSAKKMSTIIFFIYIGIIVLSFQNPSVKETANWFLTDHLGAFVLIMYFINRGSIVTQAMFYNCDHAMLTYNFYRNSKVIVGLFKKRLETVVKVNLLPAFVIAIGNITLGFITNSIDPTNAIFMFLFIIILSVFFSLHYLVIYYLLQPYDRNMKMKKASYSIVSLATYFLTYQFSHLAVSNLMLSLFGLLFCLIYIVVGLQLVERLAPRTFKIN